MDKRIPTILHPFLTAFTNRAVTPADFELLGAIHYSLAAEYRQWPLEGSYFPTAEVGNYQTVLCAYPHFHDGKLEYSTAIDQNCVTWWILKHQGITLMGRPSQQLVLTIDSSILMTGMRRNLNTYWRSFGIQSGCMLWLLKESGVQWVVLGVLRQYYSFKEKKITSKTGAGHYALEHLPRRWHRLIREAINIREESGTSSYKTRVARAWDALQFLHYIIEHCNDLAD